tara:strand:- start:55 stop:465 length:411 start_codon:yes stop_codon:yes gene_type:complete
LAVKGTDFEAVGTDPVEEARVEVHDLALTTPQYHPQWFDEGFRVGVEEDHLSFDIVVAGVEDHDLGSSGGGRHPGEEKPVGDPGTAVGQVKTPQSGGTSSVTDLETGHDELADSYIDGGRHDRRVGDAFGQIKHRQ